MTQYLLSIYQPRGDTPPREALEPITRQVETVNQEMHEAGVWVLSGGLQPPHKAAVVHHRDGEFPATDGPYLDTDEHLDGFTIIEVDDFDAALEWARKLAKALAFLPVEVRPFEDETER